MSCIHGIPAYREFTESRYVVNQANTGANTGGITGNYIVDIYRFFNEMPVLMPVMNRIPPVMKMEYRHG